MNNAKANGFDGQTNNTVTVNLNPSTYQGGQWKGQTIPVGYVEVMVTYVASRAISAPSGAQGSLKVQARAVARASFTSASPGILILDPSSKASLNAAGQGSIVVKGGGSIVVNSNNAAGGGDQWKWGTSRRAALLLQRVAVAISILEQAEISIIPAGCLSPPTAASCTPACRRPRTRWRACRSRRCPPRRSCRTAARPLRKSSGPETAMPTGAACEDQRDHWTLTLSPGTYNGGIQASGGGNLILQPGIYYMNGGGFVNTGSANITVAGPASPVTGTGVLIYNAPQSSSDRIEITGNGSTTLPAPTTGTYQGISIFQARTSNTPINITGNGNMQIGGTFYAAGAQLNITGNGFPLIDGVLDSIGAQYISKDLVVVGNGSFNINYSGGNPINVRTIQLVE